MLPTLQNYINGQWVASESGAWLDVENPSTGEPIARTPLSGQQECERAIEAAQAAFDTWRCTAAGARVEPLFRLASLLRNRQEELARTIAEEMGKSLPDARAEMKRAIQNCEVACGTPMLQQGTRLLDAAEGVDGEVLRRPIGVCAMAGPFNFPAMVPFWFLPYALATGNTFVMKPSEKVPLTMARITECIEEIGLPPGVFNMVHGDRHVVEALVDHPTVRAFSIVGSTPACRAVAARCAGLDKRFQAFGGAKNHLVVMPDAPLDLAVRNMLTSCFGCAGQRCMAASVLVAVGDAMYQTLRERFVAAAKEVPVADPLDPAVADDPMVMGPVISGQAKRSIHEMIEKGIEEGATLALDGRSQAVAGRPGGHYVGPTVFTDVRPGMRIHRTEIFGPVVCVMRAASLDEAIGVINAHAYGNGASIYTQNAAWARRFKLETRVGMIGVNVGIPAPVAYMPFGGVKASMLSAVKTQGPDIIDFYTDPVTVTERFWSGHSES